MSAEADFKAGLHRYLKEGRAALLWKLEGLSEYDLRRPLVPTGTNLLGLVKHVAMVEADYFGVCFGRPFPGSPFPAMADDAEPEADMFAAADESPQDIIDLYRRVHVHSDATIEALPLDAAGSVPWWKPESRHVTLHRILVHMGTETFRHAGHADIVRELIDGSAGSRPGDPNLPDPAAGGREKHHAKLEAIARRFA
ncbi:DinB family protein [Kineosporia sp. J2-2]|uniref:DinB family protein n=1 Tax=Kineosporia corallincola TaxID=2835133 RepID=A0ABS5TH79_9ACTN|nr:DinB family protein [Kineosporia corallincola]MBT0770448.1 DinB family protein [Kineosporia corallincola]